jgi:hypothetical protein
MEENLLLFLIQIVFLAESLHPAGGIHQFLLAGKEGVTAGADFYLDILNRGSRFYDTSARTGNLGRFVFGMDFRFHFSAFSLHSQNV